MNKIEDIEIIINDREKYECICRLSFKLGSERKALIPVMTERADKVNQIYIL